MGIRQYIVVFIAITILVPISVSEPVWAADTVSRITKESLNAVLENDELVILDLRAQPDWTSSEFKIKKALRVDPDDFGSWADLFPKNTLLVLY
jgi:hypothetical protein